MTHYFVNSINVISEKPETCTGCGRNDLIENVVIAQVDGVDKETVLCLACENCMVISLPGKGALGIRLADKNDKVTIRHSGKKK